MFPRLIGLLETSLYFLARFDLCLRDYGRHRPPLWFITGIFAVCRLPSSSIGPLGCLPMPRPSYRPLSFAPRFIVVSGFQLFIASNLVGKERAVLPQENKLTLRASLFSFGRSVSSCEDTFVSSVCRMAPVFKISVRL